MIVNGEIKEHRIQDTMSTCLKVKRVAMRLGTSRIDYQCIKSKAETEIYMGQRIRLGKLRIKMNIILIGGPGSGKSTYSEFITERVRYRITFILVNLLRKEKAKGGEMAKRLSNLGKGDFAPNDIVLKLVFDEVEKSDKGFVFDGFPRYMQQVRDLEKKNIKIDKVVLFKCK